jgi:hypothetical protein
MLGAGRDWSDVHDHRAVRSGDERDVTGAVWDTRD